jgi:hypothetical protein
MLCVFELDTTDTSDEARKRQAQLLCDVTMLLVPAAMRDIQAGKVPPLYKSGVKYARQNPSACAFKWPSMVRKAKNGDCKQLVLWRLAELHLAGETKATPRLMWLNNRKGLQAHIQIRRADGTTEDPSVNLGMKG